jgi:hypothetical protein
VADPLAQLLERYARAWSGIEPGPIAACWAPERFRFYKAEEVPRFFTKWDEVECYWRGNAALHASVELTFSDPQPLGSGGEESFAAVRMEWRIGFRDDARTGDGAAFRHSGKAMAGWNHVLIGWTLTADGARLTGWCEAPDAAPLYLSELYYRAAR